jgi:hypothetical protein
MQNKKVNIFFRENGVKGQLLELNLKQIETYKAQDTYIWFSTKSSAETYIVPLSCVDYIKISNG